MKDKIIKNIIYIVVVLSFLILTIFSVKLYFKNKDYERLLVEYKEELIKSDKLRKTEEGTYQKLVDDTNSKEELIKLISDQNKKLLDIIEKQGKRPISYTVLQAQPDSKKEKVYIEKDTSFVSYYPKKENFFVKHTGKINKDSIDINWELSKLDIGLVISEKQKGIFEADLDAPDWLNIKSLEVKALPIENKEVDNFDLFVGGQVGIELQTSLPVMDLEFGFRHKKNLFGIGINTNKEAKVGYKRLF